MNLPHPQAQEDTQRAEQEARRKAAVEKYAAEALQRRREVFDSNGRILDLLASDTVTEEEATKLFCHPGVSSLGGGWQIFLPKDQRAAIPSNSLTSDGRWHAVYPPLPTQR